MYTIKPKFYLYCFKVFSETQNDNKYKDNKKNDAEETYSYPEDTTKKNDRLYHAVF